MRALLLALTLTALLGAAPERLQIYWIDVEGGAATLIVSPSGESLLVDTGNPRPDGRDAQRVAAAAREAGLARVDYVMITRFHATWNKEHELACPVNLVGKVDVYQVHTTDWFSRARRSLSGLSNPRWRS